MLRGFLGVDLKPDTHPLKKGGVDGELGESQGTARLEVLTARWGVQAQSARGVRQGARVLWVGCGVGS